jgi:hypothetical protein
VTRHAFGLFASALVVIVAAALLGPGLATAAGPPNLASTIDFRWHSGQVRGYDFTPGGEVAVYVYDPNQSYPPGLVGWARTTATSAAFRCSLTGCRYYPGGEFTVAVEVGQSLACWSVLMLYAVDESTQTATAWHQSQNRCPFPGTE